MKVNCTNKTTGRTLCKPSHKIGSEYLAKEIAILAELCRRVNMEGCCEAILSSAVDPLRRDVRVCGCVRAHSDYTMTRSKVPGAQKNPNQQTCMTQGGTQGRGRPIHHGDESDGDQHLELAATHQNLI
eukprot:2821093-Amphidinium_carterae.1